MKSQEHNTIGSGADVVFNQQTVKSNQIL